MRATRFTPDSGDDFREGDPVNNGGYGGSTPTFADLQRTGRPRPPAPAPPRTTPLDPAIPLPAGGVPAGLPALPPTLGGPDPWQAPPMVPGGGLPGQGMPPTLGGPDPWPTAPIAPNSGGAPVPGESDFEKQLRERYQSNPAAPKFAQTASTFSPGANPFTGSNATTQQLDPALLQSVMDMLKNPSGYTTDAATSTYNRLGGSIDDQFNLDNQSIDEEMARRGIPVSTIAGGRLFDSNVARKSAKEDLAGRILTDQASTQGADRARAIAAASGLSADEYNRELGTYNTNTAEDQRGFNDALSSFNTNRASDSQAFGEGEQKLQDYLGFGQNSFNNSVTTQQINSQQQQQLLDLLMKLFGGTA